MRDKHEISTVNESECLGAGRAYKFSPLLNDCDCHKPSTWFLASVFIDVTSFHPLPWERCQDLAAESNHEVVESKGTKCFTMCSEVITSDDGVHEKNTACLSTLLSPLEEKASLKVNVKQLFPQDSVYCKSCRDCHSHLQLNSFI